MAERLFREGDKVMIAQLSGLTHCYRQFQIVEVQKDQVSTKHWVDCVGRPMRHGKLVRQAVRADDLILMQEESDD